MELEKRTEARVDEAPPAGRRVWQTPQVIVSQMSNTQGGINANTDIDGSQTS